LLVFSALQELRQIRPYKFLIELVQAASLRRLREL
jgi:hypothetical protein